MSEQSDGFVEVYKSPEYRNVQHRVRGSILNWQMAVGSTVLRPTRFDRISGPLVYTRMGVTKRSDSAERDLFTLIQLYTTQCARFHDRPHFVLDEPTDSDVP